MELVFKRWFVINKYFWCFMYPTLGVLAVHKNDDNLEYLTYVISTSDSDHVKVGVKN